ncbi:MAG: D-isomer specific 2-hydroxyacid dehydrogenase [Conexibacter sp.]|nr:D-isomer specific 2-hydroxyacid dehydrogenase [Conexibacter sp.]
MATAPTPVPPAPPASGDVLITWPDYDASAEHLGALLIGAGHRLRLEPKRGARSTVDMIGLVGGAVGAIVSTDPFNAAVLDAAAELRVIARVGVGTDSVDLAAATARGVAVTITPGANESTVADHTVALMLATLRRVTEHDAGVRAGRWDRTGDHAPWLLSESTIGLVGFGHIGRLVARRLSGFDVRVLVTDLQPAGDPAVEQVELDVLMAQSGVISLHAPLTPATRGVIGARELALARPDAILVNTARGGMIDEHALAAALREGRLRGAALDVFADEPPHASELLTLPNVILSPHIGGLSDRSIETMTRRATASVVDVLAGRRPAHLANPEVELRA